MKRLLHVIQSEMFHDRIIIFTVRMLIMSDYIMGDIRVDLGQQPT